MIFLPFETIIIETTLTKEDAMLNLTKNIEPEKTFRFINRSDTKDFEGCLRGDEFEIRRIIRYKNSFLPVISGRIETSGLATRITVKLRLNPGAMAFMLIWFGFVTLFLIASIIKPGDPIETVVLPIVMLVFGYAVTIGAYLFESYRTKEILTHILN